MTESIARISAIENLDVSVDFDDSCGLDSLTGYLLPDSQRADVEFLKDLYERNRLGNVPVETTAKIPKIIHQVWIGQNPLPDEYKRYRSHWKNLHPGWETKLWTDKDVADFDFGNKDIYFEASSFGQKVDILRAEILNEFGGLYVDVDYDCYKPLDVFHHCYDFYSTLRAYPFLYMWWKELYQSPLTVCGSLAAATRGHPILRTYSRTVREAWERVRRGAIRKDLRLPLFGRRRNRARWERLCETIPVTYRTFHDSVIQEAGRDDRIDIVFPPTFFNPVDTWVERHQILYPDYWKFMLKNRFRRCTDFTKVRDHSFTHHNSTATWL